MESTASERNSFVGALRRQWWIVVGTAVLGLVIGLIPASSKSTSSASTYDATHTLLLSSNDPSGSLSSDTVNINEIQLLASAGDVPRKVAEAIGDITPGVLALKLTVDFESSTNALTITARDASPDRAVLIADTVAEELSRYVTTRQDSVREERLAAATERLAVLQKTVEELSAQAARASDDRILQAKLDAATRRYSTVYEEFESLQDEPLVISMASLQSAEATAVAQQGLRAPRSRLARSAFLALIGAIIGAGVVLLLSVLDPRIRRRSQAEAILGTRAQLTIPASVRLGERLLAVRRDRHDPVADSYRALRSVISLSNHDRDDPSRAPITLVLSSGPGDGKTSATANLAAAFTETGARTLAVNTDFRRPALSGLVGADPDARPAPEVIDGLPIVSAKGVPGLRVYDERSVDTEATPSELARKVVRAIPRLRDAFEEVVVDTAPVALAAEILELLPLADTIVVIVRLGHTRIQNATRTAETLRALGVNDFLLVLIGEAQSADDAYYYGSETMGGTGRSGALSALKRLGGGTLRSND